MTDSRALSIRTRLILIQLMTASIVLVFCSMVLIVNGKRLFRESLLQRTASMAQLLASGCEAPLMFMDARTAEENLSALAAEEQAVNAWVYDEAGKVFAAYHRAGFEVAPERLKDARAHRFAGEFLTLSRAVVVANAAVGVVVLR